MNEENQAEGDGVIQDLRNRWVGLVKTLPKKPRLREIEAMVRAVDQLIEERND